MLQQSSKCPFGKWHLAKNVKVNTVGVCALDNVSVFKLQSICLIDCNLAIRWIEIKHLKWLTEFKSLSFETVKKDF